MSRPAFALLLCALPAAGQSCDNALTASDGYLVGRVTLRARHLAAIPLATRVGAPYNPASQSLSFAQLSSLFASDLAENVALDAFLSRIPAASYTGACTHILPPEDCITLVHQPKCVEVVFSRYQIALDLDRLNSFASSTPRSPFASFLGGVPTALKILNPTAGLASDDRLGTSPSGTAHVDLLTLPALVAGRRAPQFPVAFAPSAAAGHALQHDFYSTSEQLDLASNGASTTRLSLHLARLDSRQPLGTATDQLGSTAAGLELNLRAGPVGLTAWSGFRDENHTNPTTVAERNSLSTLIAESHAHGLLIRSALWFTAAYPAQFPTYQRLAFSTSAYRDLALAPNQAIGLQLGFSTGATFGPAPAYAAFYPGNNAAGFLFTDRPSLLTQLPAGPSPRSLGTAEGTRAAPGGVPAYVGFTSTVSVPVPRWSLPLIPNVSVFDTLTLKTMLIRAATVTNKNILAASLEQRGLTHDEAQKQAAQIIDRDVAPAVTYIANQANLYSIKPILALDYARTRATSRPTSLVSLGPGLELTLVNIALQAGYARTLGAPATTRQGNFFLSLQFRNFF